MKKSLSTREGKTNGFELRTVDVRRKSVRLNTFSLSSSNSRSSTPVNQTKIYPAVPASMNLLKTDGK